MVEKKFLYCITHEAWTYPELMDYIGKDCLFTTSMPPELPEDWERNVPEPSPAELSRMNIAANDLLMDVIGAGL